MNYTSLVEILEARKNLTATGITFIEGANEEDFLPYSELYDSAKRVLYILQQKGVAPKNELVFQIESNKAFLITFWACILGGIIPVPLTIGAKKDHKKKLLNVWDVLENPYLVISENDLGNIRTFAEENGLEASFYTMSSKCFRIDEIFETKDSGIIYHAQENDIAFIQFSSGSTGKPKGVTLTHKNLITNITAIATAAEYSSEDSMLSWMPLTHDMGLIGFHINPLFSGIDHYLIPTNLFVRHPSLWFSKASQHKITILCSPNFGYKYVMKHCSKAEHYTWDLSAVRLLYNGAEPISLELCNEFLTWIAQFGLRKNAMCPVYGLAEASLAVSISRLQDEIIAYHIDRASLNFGDSIAHPTNDKDAVAMVNVGSVIDDCLLKITDDYHNEVEAETIGHIQIKGDNVTKGYYNNTGDSKRVFYKGWLKTGDLGFVKNGCLYITGRAKDVIFVNGQNYYAHDIEYVAQQITGIELNKIVVSGFLEPHTRSEQVCAFIFHRGSLEKFVPIITSLNLLINDVFGFKIDHVLPVRDIPRTTSGKLQRFKLLESFRNGELDKVYKELSGLLKKSETGKKSTSPSGNDEEIAVLNVWKQVLNSDRIGIEDKFLELGGNSLKAAEISMILKEKLHVDISPELLFEKDTVKELTATIRNLNTLVCQPIKKANLSRYYPLSTNQKRIYYAWAMNPTSIAYNMPVALKISGDLSLPILTDCIHRLVKKYDTLRMSFNMDNEPRITIMDKVHFELHHLEYSQNNPIGQLQSLIQPFDLTKPPLFRAHVLQKDIKQRVLFLDFHHIISDGVSIFNFVKELFDLYSGVTATEKYAQYRDYIIWEKEMLKRESVFKQKEYWLQKLGQVPPILDLSYDYPRPSLFHNKGSKLSYTLSAVKSEDLRKLATTKGCTMNVLLFTVYFLLLSKYSGQHDMVIGIPASVRQHPDLMYSQGMFVNNLPIRINSSGKDSFETLLEYVKIQITDALKHRDYPFDSLVSDLINKRDVSRNPLFDTMFIFQNVPLAEISHENLELSVIAFDPGFAKYDISLEILDYNDAIEYSIEYSSRLFKPSTIEQLRRHFEQLITAVLFNPAIDVKDIDLLTDEELDYQIGTFNQTEQNTPVDKCIHQLFEIQAESSPSAVAIVSQGQSIIYEDVNRRANELAAYLKSKGIRHNTPIAVFLKRSPEFIISVLGILKAGGCFVPIATDFPKERISYILSNSKSAGVITSNSHIKCIEGIHQEYENSDLWIHNVEVQIPPFQHRSFEQSNSPRNLAYIIYTSGTTGNPKGVMISHRSLVNYCSWAVKFYLGEESSTFPLFTSISFDLSLTSIFTPLISGNTIVIYPETDNELPLANVISDDRAAIIKVTPSHLKIALAGELFKEGTLPSFNRVIVGGEKLENHIAKALYEKFNGKLRIFNEYGPTEATVGCMIYEYRYEDGYYAVPIGRPIANTQVYVLDNNLKPVPIGVHGELYVSGLGLATGYLGDKQLTDKKFVSNPFLSGQKMYRTGDIVKFLGNQNIEFVGRLDQQIKLNGHRIEPAEIENILTTHNGISDAVVLLYEINEKRKALCAYCRPGKDAAPPTSEALRVHMARQLPHYMIPTNFIIVDSFPLTANGKIDYTLLPDPTSTNEPLPEQLGPEIEMEKILLKVWKTIFDNHAISRKTNFFELGGDSITAVKIVSRLREEGIALKVTDLLTYQTIAQVSLFAKFENSAPQDQGILSGEKELHPIERWFFDNAFYNPNFYNQSILLELHKKVSKVELERVFSMLIAHHDGLRLNFDREKQLLFYNNSLLEKKFKIETIRENKPSFNLKNECVSIKKRFVLSRGFLIKAALIRGNSTKDKLFITAHHLIFDGISWRIFLQDLYKIITNTSTYRLPQKTASLKRWSRQLTTTAFNGEQEYWNYHSGGDFCLPLDSNPENWKMANAAKIKGALSKDATQYLLKGANEVYRTNALILLITSLVLSLREWTDLSDFTIELENQGRTLDDIDVSRTIGWFTILHPLRVKTDQNEAIGTTIKRTKELIKNIPNFGMGYGMQFYKEGKKVSVPQMSEIRFNYLGQFSEALSNDLFKFSGEDIGPETDTNNNFTTKLELNLMVLNGSLNIEMVYNNTAHKENTIQKFQANFLGTIYTVLDHIQSENDIHFTPSDFEAVELNQEDLNNLFG